MHLGRAFPDASWLKASFTPILNETSVGRQGDSIYKYNKGDLAAKQTNKKPNKKIKTPMYYHIEETSGHAL